MNVYVKMGLTIAGITLGSISAVYTANPAAPAMAYVAGAAAPVGAYLVGLFQSSPAQQKGAPHA